MEFKQLEAFVNVIRYKSFSRAAEATYLTQPTISTHISSLDLCESPKCFRSAIFPGRFPILDKRD